MKTAPVEGPWRQHIGRTEREGQPSEVVFTRLHDEYIVEETNFKSLELAFVALMLAHGTWCARPNGCLSGKKK